MVDILKHHSWGSQEDGTVHFHPFVRRDGCRNAIQYSGTSCTDEEERVTCARCNSILSGETWMKAASQPIQTYNLSHTGYEVIRSRREAYLQLSDGKRADLWRVNQRQLSLIIKQIDRMLAEWDTTPEPE